MSNFSAVEFNRSDFKKKSIIMNCKLLKRLFLGILAFSLGSISCSGNANENKNILEAQQVNTAAR